MAGARTIAQFEAELGDRIRVARKRAGLTQAQLAERANISLSAARAIESGAGSRLASFLSVVRALNLDESLERAFVPTANVSPMAMLRAQQGRGRG